MTTPVERGPRRPRAAIAWSLFLIPFLATAAMFVATGYWPMAIPMLLLGVIIVIRAWSAFTGITHVGAR
jgi:hypothetical protein